MTRYLSRAPMTFHMPGGADFSKRWEETFHAPEVPMSKDTSPSLDLDDDLAFVPIDGAAVTEKFKEISDADLKAKRHALKTLLFAAHYSWKDGPPELEQQYREATWEIRRRRAIARGEQP